MSKRQTILCVCLAAGILVAALVLRPVLWSPRSSIYSSKVDGNSYSVGMEPLNSTLSQPFSLRKGDAIDVSVAHISGEVTITIGQENQRPIYEGRNPDLGSFRVNIPEDGQYLLCVSGKQAEGSVSFAVTPAAE